MARFVCSSLWLTIARWLCLTTENFLTRAENLFRRSYVAAAYIKWIEQAGGRAVPIRYVYPNTASHALSRHFLWASSGFLKVIKETLINRSS